MDTVWSWQSHERVLSSKRRETCPVCVCVCGDKQRWSSSWRPICQWICHGRSFIVHKEWGGVGGWRDWSQPTGEGWIHVSHERIIIPDSFVGCYSKFLIKPGRRLFFLLLLSSFNCFDIFYLLCRSCGSLSTFNSLGFEWAVLKNGQPTEVLRRRHASNKVLVRLSNAVWNNLRLKFHKFFFFVTSRNLKTTHTEVRKYAGFQPLSLSL